MKVNAHVVSVVLLVTLVVSALFGFVMMNHEAGHAVNSNADCILGFFNTSACPQSPLLYMAFHHIGAYQSFAGALISFFILSAILGAGLFLIAQFISEPDPYPPAVFTRFHISSYAYALAEERERDWRSHFTNSQSRD